MHAKIQMTLSIVAFILLIMLIAIDMTTKPLATPLHLTSYMGAVLLILLSMNILVAYLVKQQKRQADNQTK